MFRWNISLLRKYQKFHLFSSCICLSQTQLEIKKMALHGIFHLFLLSGTHTHTHPHPPSTISSRADTNTELIFSLPQTKNVSSQKICALQEAHFGDAFFYGSGSVSFFFFSAYAYKHKYVPLRKTLVSISNHSCPFTQLWFRLGDWSFSLGHEK